MALKVSDLQNRIPGNALNYGYDTIMGNETAGGTGFPYYASLLGVELEVDNGTALMLSYTTNGTLYAGLYRYMGFITTGTTTPTLGYATFWATTQITTSGASTNILATDGTQYTVSVDGSASVGDALFAGVILVTDPSGAAATTLAARRFGWIQTEGIATCYFGGTTDTTIGDLVVTNYGSNTFQALADTAATPKAGGQAFAIKNVVGVAVNAPSATAASQVSLWPKNLIF
jgi:hypothetical protein